MEKRPMVTVVLPCYNHEKFVRQSIESVLNQTYKNIELVILDNGSTDGSREIIREYEQKAVIVYFDQNDINEGRKAFRKATRGDYLAIMTSDDLWEPEKIEKQVDFLENYQEYDACFTWTDYFNESMTAVEQSMTDIFRVENQSVGEWIFRFWKNGNCLCCPSAFMRVEAYFEIWEQDVSYWQHYDFVAWIRFLLAGRKFFVMPEVLVHMRMHVTAISFSEKAGNRALDEMNSIRIEMLENISDDLFIEAFSKQFVRLNAQSHEELVCEKILLLFREGQNLVAMQPLVLDFFYKHYAEPNVQETLTGVYKKDRQYFNQLCSDFGVNAIVELERNRGVRIKQQIKQRRLILKGKIDSFIADFVEIKQEKLSYKDPVIKELYTFFREIEEIRQQSPGFSTVFDEKQWRYMRNICRKGEEIDVGELLIYLYRLKTYFDCLDGLEIE